jgi:hypothetical protein
VPAGGERRARQSPRSLPGGILLSLPPSFPGTAEVRPYASNLLENIEYDNLGANPITILANAPYGKQRPLFGFHISLGNIFANNAETEILNPPEKQESSEN